MSVADIEPLNCHSFLLELKKWDHLPQESQDQISSGTLNITLLTVPRNATISGIISLGERSKVGYPGTCFSGLIYSANLEELPNPESYRLWITDRALPETAGHRASKAINTLTSKGWMVTRAIELFALVLTRCTKSEIYLYAHDSNQVPYSYCVANAAHPDIFDFGGAVPPDLRKNHFGRDHGYKCYRYWLNSAPKLSGAAGCIRDKPDVPSPLVFDPATPLELRDPSRYA